MKLANPSMALLAVSLLVGAGTAAQGQEYKRENPIVLAVRKAMPSIVNIKVERRGQWGTREGAGTGVIIDERGYVVTNRHVVGNATKIQVILPDKTEVAGELHTEDGSHDLAIVRLPKGKYRALKFGPGSDLMVGETVIAIGHPYGYDNTVSTGIVSALGRTINMPSGERLTNLIQTNASINPGNSGGPLININGELIGINVALREGAQGIAFALNADMVQTVLAKHLSASRQANVQHGLVCKEQVVQSTGKDRQRVVVETVADKSPAARAGLKSGDVLVKVAGFRVNNRFDVERAFWSYKEGDKVEAAVLREGRETHLALTVTGGSGEHVASAGETTGTTGTTDPVQAAGDR